MVDPRARARWRALLAGLMLASCAAPAGAALLPADFFDQVPAVRDAQFGIEAARVVYDPASGNLLAEGMVALSYADYSALADRATLNRRTGEVLLEGNVIIRDPSGTVYRAESYAMTGKFAKMAFRALVLETENGTRITADSADFDDAVESVLENGTYSPCGDCIDDKGRRIGWQASARRIIYDPVKRTVYLEQPVISIVGVPVAWLPFYIMSDPSAPDAAGWQLPSYAFNAQYGHRLDFPYLQSFGPDTRAMLTPSLMSRQGLMMAGELHHRFDIGKVRLWAAGLYQLAPGAYAGEVGDRTWRGALQTSGRFTPTREWTLGWSYTAFTDAGFLSDYGFADGHVVNEVYAERLDEHSFADLRLQEFRMITTSPLKAVQGQQGTALPNLRYHAEVPVGPGEDRAIVDARLLGVTRDVDHVVGPAVHGFAGQKVHGNVEAAWTTDFVVGSALISPYLGLRADAATYDGASGHIAAPGAATQFALTPIAAIDMRYPLAAVTADSVHIFEPIVQFVYRGSATGLPGITNDNAQSFVFDDANLFSFDRFTGSDRQETGLRANVGGRYAVNFSDGSWLDFTLGQSFHLAGVNSFAMADPTLATTSTGLDTTASHIVAAVQASPFAGLNLSGKAIVDPNAGVLVRAGVGARYSYQRFTVAGEYQYAMADPALGFVLPRHQIGASVGVPIDDYWRVTGNLSWDLTGNSWLSAGGGIAYDDGYFEAGLGLQGTGPTHSNPNDIQVRLNFKLKDADHQQLLGASF